MRLECGKKANKVLHCKNCLDNACHHLVKCPSKLVQVTLSGCNCVKMDVFLVCCVFMTFACNIQILAISSLDEEEMKLLKEEFIVPTAARGTRIKSVLVQFWQNTVENIYR